MEQLDIPHFTLDEWRAMGHTIADPDLFLLGGERDSHLLRRRLQGEERAGKQEGDWEVNGGRVEQLEHATLVDWGARAAQCWAER